MGFSWSRALFWVSVWQAGYLVSMLLYLLAGLSSTHAMWAAFVTSSAATWTVQILDMLARLKSYPK